MSCERQADALMGYLYGELTPPEAEAFLAHAKGCQDCGKELDGLGAMRRTLSRAEALPDPHEALTARILDAARAEMKTAAAPAPKPAGFFERLMRPWVMGLAVTATAAAGLVLVSRQQLHVMSPADVAQTAPATAPAPVVAVAEAPKEAAGPRQDPALRTLESLADQGAGSTRSTMDRADKKPVVAEEKAAERRESDKMLAVGSSKAGVRVEGTFDAKTKGKAEASLDDTLGRKAADARPGDSQPTGMDQDQRLRSAGKLEAQRAPRKNTAPAEDIPLEKQKESKRSTLFSAAEPEAVEEPAKKSAPSMRPMATATSKPQGPLSLPPPPPAAAPAPKAESAASPMQVAPQNQAPAPDYQKRQVLAREQPADDERQAPVTPSEASGGAGNALVVPGYKRDELRSNKTVASRALAKDKKMLDGMKKELHSQEDLSAGSEMLRSGQLPEALAAFQRAEASHGGDAVALGARAGQVAALSRMDRCSDAVTIARRLGQQAPKYAGRPAMLREVAGCFDRARNTALAQALRKEADEATQLASTGGSAEHAETVARAIRRDAAALLACERVATSQGELPRAAGPWNVAVKVDPAGRVQSVRASGPAPASQLQRCLEDMARNAVIPSLPEPTSATVVLTVQPRATGGGAVLKARAKDTESNAEPATQAR